jgi:hypothetical protein
MATATLPFPDGRCRRMTSLAAPSSHDITSRSLVWTEDMFLEGTENLHHGREPPES